MLVCNPAKNVYSLFAGQSICCKWILIAASLLQACCKLAACLQQTRKNVCSSPFFLLGLFWITFVIQSLKWKRPINFCAIKHVQNMCRYTLLSTKVICLGAYLIQSHLNTCPWFSSKWFFTVTKKLWADRTQLSMHELFCLKSHFLVPYLKHIIHVNKVKIYSF